MKKDIDEGDKVKVNTFLRRGQIGIVRSYYYTSGIKGIGRGWKYYLKFDGEYCWNSFNEEDLEKVVPHP